MRRKGLPGQIPHLGGRYRGQIPRTGKVSRPVRCPRHLVQSWTRMEAVASPFEVLLEPLLAWRMDCHRSMSCSHLSHAVENQPSVCCRFDLDCGTGILARLLPIGHRSRYPSPHEFSCSYTVSISLFPARTTGQGVAEASEDKSAGIAGVVFVAGPAAD